MTSFWEILKSSKNLKASDAFAELWGKSIADSWDIITITGALPLTFEAKGEALTDYRIYGTENGAGEKTENWFDYTAKNTENGFRENVYLFPNGLANTSPNYNISEYIEVLPNTTYTIAPCVGNTPGVCEYGSDKTFIVGVAYNNAGTITFTTTATTKYIRFSVRITREAAIMITPGSTAPASYIPFGYQIPLTNTSGVTENVLIDGPYKKNYYINENGQETAQGGFNIYKTDTLDTTLGEYSFYFAEYGVNTTMRVHGYSNGVWQQQITTFANIHSATITKPQGIDEIRISCSTGYTGRTLVKGSTAPDHYIPHRYETSYNLYIGDSKLGEEEYLDYGEQKIYKDVSGTLTPTNPPIPLPALSTYQGENTLSSAETVGEVSVTGKIKEI